MIARFINWIVGDITPTQMEGLLYTAIGVSTANLGVLTADEVWKYLNPSLVFYLKWGTILFNSLVVSLKMFRSTSYSDHLKEKDKTP